MSVSIEDEISDHLDEMLSQYSKEVVIKALRDAADELEREP